MNQYLQYTPSVYFNFDDTANKNSFSKSNLFQLSCTNQKNHILNHNIELPTKIISSEDEVIVRNQKKLKTDQFFEEFDNNFIVTFDQESAPIINQQANVTSCIINYSNINNSSVSFTNNWTNVNQPECCLKEAIFSNLQSVQLNTILQQNQLQKAKIIEQSSLSSKQLIPVKQKNSPIPSFEIKKRTVFKNKQNILNNQQFKITKKKILSKNTLQIFLDQSKSCIPHKSKHQQHQNQTKCFTSKIQINQRSTVQNSFKNNFAFDNKYQSDNIFIEHKQFRQSFRSITLNNWKRKLHKRKISNEKTTKRENVFQHKQPNQHIFLRRQ